MPKIQMVGLQRRTIGIINDFFKDIDELDVENKGGYQKNLPLRVKEFFDDMNQLGEQEFEGFFTEDEFENTNSDKQKKYTDAFDCLVALIVAKYDESDLFEYFLPKQASIEARPTLDPNAWMVAHWARLLGYWVRKLFNTQRFVVNAENESLGSAITEIKKALSKNSYFKLKKHDSSFKENLKTVVSKFVENRNKANVEPAVSNASSSGDVSPQGNDSQEFFRTSGFNFGSSRSTSEQATTSVLPPPSPPPALKSGTVKPVNTNPGPSISSGKTTKPPSSKVVDNDRDDLLKAIRGGVILKGVKEVKKREEKRQLPNKPNVKSDDPFEALKETLAKRRDAVEGSLKKTQDDEGWEEAETLGSETTEQLIAIPSKVQPKKISNLGGFFSKPPSSKTDEKDEKILSNDRSSLTG